MLLLNVFCSSQIQPKHLLGSVTVAAHFRLGLRRRVRVRRVLHLRQVQAGHDLVAATKRGHRKTWHLLLLLRLLQGVRVKLDLLRFRNLVSAQAETNLARFCWLILVFDLLDSVDGEGELGGWHAALRGLGHVDGVKARPVVRFLALLRLRQILLESLLADRFNYTRYRENFLNKFVFFVKFRRFT